MRYNKGKKKDGNQPISGTEYLTFWYAAQIPHDAVREENTGMPDEVAYETHLLSIEEALEKLAGLEVHRKVVEIAWKLWTESKSTIGSVLRDPLT